ncbi:hypothetical protein BHE74_00017408 [Ensete ventricosum]|nr:hypothetical protein GW17_00003394 [Ensete ventricosum]RWW74653.1 hypothetical protein BHE74_00017408 [Ensete ventricosum]
MDGIGSSNHKVDSRSKPYVGAAAILLRVDEPCPHASSSGPIGPLLILVSPADYCSLPAVYFSWVSFRF